MECRSWQRKTEHFLWSHRNSHTWIGEGAEPCPLKPWQRLGLTKEKYLQACPWKMAEISRDRYKELILMKVCIHRGTKEIGGTCIEIESQGQRIVLDIGLPLDTELDNIPLPPVSGFKNHDRSLLGVFISHPHLDHYGLSQKIEQDVPVLIGADALRIINAANSFAFYETTLKNVLTIKNKKSITLGPFKLTPYLVDHSAYDSYALLVEADNKRLFYSGDFRRHGRKGKLFERFISNAPKNIDVLLMEGSTLGRSEDNNVYPSEADLEKTFIGLFKKTKGLVLLWCSGQNIDRLVTIYRACRYSGKQFIADMYTAHILQSIGNARIPQPGWKGFRVYLPKFQKKTIIKKKLFDLAQSFSQWRIYSKELNDHSDTSVLLFRPSMMIDFEDANFTENATLVYSLWQGYLKDERYKRLFNWMKEKNIQLIHCHTSGHAPLTDLKEFAEAVSPKMLVPIHTFVPDLYTEYFKNVVLKNDGEWWEI